MRRASCAAVLSVAAAAAAAAATFAAPPRALAGNPPPDYAVDVFYGPAFGSTRIIGMGGAYSAIAEGAEGLLHNPAAVANRYRYSLKWFDYDLGFDYYFFLLRDKTDFDNDERTDYTDLKQFMFFLAPALHFGNFSFALTWIHQAFSYTTARGLPAFDGDLDIDVAHLAVGYRFFKGTVVLGLGTRFHGVNIQGCNLATPVDAAPGGDSTFRPELGFLWRPSSLPVRAGIALRARATVSRPLDCTTTLPIPESVVLPGELQLGFAYSIGGRILNRHWVNARARVNAREREIEEIREARRAELRVKMEGLHVTERAKVAREWDEREKKLRAEEDALLAVWRKHIVAHDKARLRTEDRMHTTFAIDVLFTEAVPNALGIEQAVAAAPATSMENFTPGARFAVTPRFGVESEVWHDRMKVRGGLYLEPGRYEGTSVRPHVTSGIELRLFYFTPPVLIDRFGVRAGATMDVAPRYVNVSVSVGIWH